MREYHYLVASLSDLLLDDSKPPMPMSEFLDFCLSELHPQDAESLKRMFLFNDLKNAVRFRKEGDPFAEPSYYSKEDFLENRADPDSFMPFMSEYFFRESQGKWEHNVSTLEDQALMLFYEYLESMPWDSFIKRYYWNELVLRNIRSALVARQMGQPVRERLILADDFAEAIAKSNAPDFGLSMEYPYIEKLNAAFQNGQLTQFEKECDLVRWDHLDVETEGKTFTAWFVFSAAVKLEAVERWQRLSPEAGREMLNKMIDSIRRRISFPAEFTTMGGTK